MAVNFITIQGTIKRTNTDYNEVTNVLYTVPAGKRTKVVPIAMLLDNNGDFISPTGQALCPSSPNVKNGIYLYIRRRTTDSSSDYNANSSIIAGGKLVACVTTCSTTSIPDIEAEFGQYSFDDSPPVDMLLEYIIITDGETLEYKSYRDNDHTNNPYHDYLSYNLLLIEEDV